MIREEGRVVRGKEITLFIRPNGLGHNRFGCIVGRRVSDRPVVRNKMKRWLREIFRRNREIVPAGNDLLVMMTGQPAEKSYLEIEEKVVNIFRINKL